MARSPSGDVAVRYVLPVMFFYGPYGAGRRRSIVSVGGRDLIIVKLTGWAAAQNCGREGRSLVCMIASCM